MKLMVHYVYKKCGALMGIYTNQWEYVTCRKCLKLKGRKK